MNCAYTKCECPAGAGPELDKRQYCSAYCVDAEVDDTEEACGCGHPECSSVWPPERPDYWANHP
jgi:hypothetical protein